MPFGYDVIDQVGGVFSRDVELGRLRQPGVAVIRPSIDQ